VLCLLGDSTVLGNCTMLCLLGNNSVLCTMLCLLGNSSVLCLLGNSNVMCLLGDSTVLCLLQATALQQETYSTVCEHACVQNQRHVQL